MTAIDTLDLNENNNEEVLTKEEEVEEDFYDCIADSVEKTEEIRSKISNLFEEQNSTVLDVATALVAMLVSLSNEEQMPADEIHEIINFMFEVYSCDKCRRDCSCDECEICDDCRKELDNG
jgi:phage-related tail protein